MTPTVIFLLLALFGANIGFKVYVTRKRRPRNRSVTKSPFVLRQELLKRINKLNRFEEGGYNNETKEAIKTLAKKIMELDEQITMEENEDQMHTYIFSVEALENEVALFSNQLQASIETWEKVKEEVLENIEFARDFFDKNNFYPTDFTHDTNRLERKRNDLVDEMRKNPLSDPTPFRTYNNEFRAKFELYLSLHSKTSTLLTEYEQVKEKLSTEKVNLIHDLKQELFFSLQNAKLKDAEKTLRAFKRELIKAQKK